MRRRFLIYFNVVLFLNAVIHCEPLQLGKSAVSDAVLTSASQVTERPPLPTSHSSERPLLSSHSIDRPLPPSHSLDRVYSNSSSSSLHSQSADDTQTQSRSNSRPLWDRRPCIAECQVSDEQKVQDTAWFRLLHYILALFAV